MKKPEQGSRACLWVRSIADQSLGKSLRQVQQRLAICQCTTFRLAHHSINGALVILAHHQCGLL